jgi:SRSO17 transposase
LAYLSGLLRLEAKRNIANIGRQTGVAEQNMEHFMSQSPWSGREVIARMQGAVAERPELVGGALIVDDSGEEKAGESSAGASRQYNGRHKRVETSQNGVFLAYTQGNVWSWIDGELYLPKEWFSAGHAQQRQKVGLPSERQFHTKTELGWQMIQRAMAAGIPFKTVLFDSSYGHEAWFRDRCRAAGLEYYGDVRGSALVYLRDPRQATSQNELQQWAWRVEHLVDEEDTDWQHLVLRPDARGMLEADFAMLPVWTRRQDGTVVAEILLLRRDTGEHFTYTLTNAPPSTSLEELARRKAQRYFIERSIQEAKSELGWDEFQALRYRAWEHQLALTILASWFIAETRLDWQAENSRDPSLTDDYQMTDLPALSVANVRELLRAALPLPQLSSQQAALLVVQHLDNRARSRRSRLKNRSGP